GNLTIDVNASPFGLVVHDAKGNVLMESTTAHTDAADASDPIDSYAPLSFTHNEDETVEVPMKGWDYYKGQDDPWQQATDATEIDTTGASLTVHLASTDGHTLTLLIEPAGNGVHLLAT